MVDSQADAVRVQSRPGPFGPAKQSFEIRNDSKTDATVHLERTGSEYFRLPESSHKLRLKPGQSIRAHVEFAPPARGKPMTLSAIYRGAIKVWLRPETRRGNGKLLDIVNLQGTGPGWVSPRDVHCFDPIGSAEPEKPGKKQPPWPRRR
jgi:hypothetical protein